MKQLKVVIKQMKTIITHARFLAYSIEPNLWKNLIHFKGKKIWVKIFFSVNTNKLQPLI